MLLVLYRRTVLAACALPLFLLGGILGHRQLSPPAPVVIIDPGHGGIDGGCQDSQGHLEKDLNLDISRCFQAKMASLGIAASMTRSDDRDLGKTYREDLEARVAMARKASAKALVSIHANWHSDPAAEGAVTVIPPGSPASAAMAKAILARLKAVCPYVQPEPMALAGHALLQSAPFPIVLVETGFLSNPAEAQRLRTKEYCRALGQAIALGVADYLGMTAARSPGVRGNEATPAPPR